MIHTDRQRTSPRQLCGAPGFDGPHNLIGHQYVCDSACHKCFSFADLLAADSNRAGSDLQSRDIGTLVGLPMRADAKTRRVQPLMNLVHVELERIKIKNQRWGVDFCNRHPWYCRRDIPRPVRIRDQVVDKK
ncbi:hypothetical protein D3C85_1135400 [compost metagenome]